MDDKKELDMSGISEMFNEPTANKISVGIVSFFLIFLGINTVDLIDNNEKVRAVVDGDSDWTVSFEEQIVALSNTIVVADGAIETVDFVIEDTLVAEGYRIGGFAIQVTYGETSGIPGDPLDSVFASIKQNDLKVVWGDENNTMTGSSNDGSSIDLYLRAYEGYDGENKNMTGYNEIQVLGPWLMDGTGLGTLNVELSVETNALPFTTDNEEEITVNVNIITFKPTAIN